MYEDILLSPMRTINQKEDTVYSIQDLFIEFINKIEGWKTKCKNLHWSAPKKNIHIYLDDFLVILSNYQDSLAEEYQGILGKMQPNAVEGIKSNTLNALDFIEEVKEGTLSFYKEIPQEIIYRGIISECETFIHNINKFRYLFNLCDVRPY